MRPAARAIAVAIAMLAAPLACAPILGLPGEVTVEEGNGGASASSTSGTGGSSDCGDTESDPQNCGACGHDCLGGECSAGACVPLLLADGHNGPWGIAVDDTRVFWVDEGGGALNQASKIDGSGGGLMASPANGIAGSIGVAVDASGVYFTSTSDATAGVFYCALDAIPCTPLQFDPMSNTPVRVKVSGGRVYWLDMLEDEIRAADVVTGANLAKVASIDDSYIGGEFADLAVDGTGVFWTECTQGFVRRHPFTGAQSNLAAGQAFPQPIAVDGNALYWANAGSNNGQGTIATLPADGSSSAITTLAASQRTPSALAVDATHVYWLNEGDYPSFENGSLARCARTGCSNKPEVLVQDLHDPRGIALDDEAIYFTTWGDGKVWKLAK